MPFRGLVARFNRWFAPAAAAQAVSDPANPTQTAGPPATGLLDADRERDHAGEPVSDGERELAPPETEA